MFGFKAQRNPTLTALSQSLGIIEFDPRGTILTANPNFCAAVGYDLSEIVGQHHSMFVDPECTRSPDYREFWAKLGRGEFDAGEYKRIGKGGREIWIQASYNPVKNSRGVVTKVVKQATDITGEKLRAAEVDGKLDAISRVQAVIEFNVKGEVITANENFLKTLGYHLDEIRGQHHRMFVEPSYAQSAEYREFWSKLNGGDYVAGEFKRVGKGGREVWIQASYNPVFDMNRRVTKVVKFATDVTGRVQAVAAIGAAVEQLAAGDLTYRIEAALPEAYEKLRSDLNAAIAQMQAAMQAIAGNVGGIRSGTSEITQAADDLSRRTEQQAASLEQTAAALDEITATVRRTAEGAKQARAVVSKTKTDAEHSGEVVRQAVAAMGGIEQSSQQISQIIGVIDEIAFQTNLLALNAGVEAARAGDAGRGFAVVASEVRALAQRSAEAAKEIKALISASAQQVGSGVKFVGETGEALSRIVAQVAEINSAVVEIASAAQEQATGLAEVNTAVNQMDQVTQQNAAMVEQSTAASHALAGEADELARLMGRFQLGQEEGGMPTNVEPLRRPAKAAPRPAKPTAALRVVAQGGRGREAAARKPVAAAAEEGWQEF